MVAIPLICADGPFLALFFGLSYAMGRDQVSLADRIGKTAVGHRSLPAHTARGRSPLNPFNPGRA